MKLASLGAPADSQFGPSGIDTQGNDRRLPTAGQSSMGAVQRAVALLALLAVLGAQRAAAFYLPGACAAGAVPAQPLGFEWGDRVAA